jgi:HD-GYP domain-containing protein (c-di-GMP phosphodiesterase class II)
VDRLAAAIGRMVDSSVHEAGHASSVAMLAVEIGRQLDLDESYRRALRIASQVLDLGQLGVPRHITEKPAILSVDEMEIMRQHPGWAAQILEPIPGFMEVAHWVESHHERPDGRGYPEGLDGNEVPLGARILAVTDSFWALCSERPYRPALTPLQAVGVIEDGAGTQYDPSVVRVLRSALAAMRAHSRRADAA